MKTGRKIAFDILTEYITSGEIKSRSQLKDEILNKGWVITKEGDDYLSVRTQTSRFRFRFDLLDSKVEGWIYSLVAFNQYERACYIGSTSSFHLRMNEHLRIHKLANPNSQNASSDLYLWAKRRKIKVDVVTLEKICGACKLINREAEWTNAFKNTSWVMPGIDRWGNRAKRQIVYCPEGANLVLPINECLPKMQLAKAKWLRDVVRKNIQPSELLCFPN